MSCKIENDVGVTVGVTLYKIALKYMTTKQDNYKNEITYYSIQNINFEDIVKDVPPEMKTPYFENKEKDGYIIKIKSKYLTEAQKVSGTATIKMKQYNYESFNGYFVKSLEIN